MVRIILTVVLLSTAIAVNAKHLVLVEFQTDSYDSTLNLLSKIEQIGGTARHIFVPSAAIVDIHELAVDIFRKDSNEYRILTKGDFEGAPILSNNEVAKNAFFHLTDSVQTEHRDILQVSSQIKNSMKFCQSSAKESAMGSEQLASLVTLYTGQYMIGYIVAGIYLLESTGSQEDWWPAAEQQTFNEIVQGLDWLGELGFQRGSKVVWVYPPYVKVSTSYEPISGPSMPNNGDFNWLNDIYSSEGEANGWDGAYGLANKLRRIHKTNWAVEIAVVMDENDADDLFADSVSSYAVLHDDNRSPIVVTSYDGVYGPANMDFVISHEVSHAFGASDEKYDPPSYVPPTCSGSGSCGHQYAFLTYIPAVNGNCEACNPNSAFCYMNDNPDTICSFTPAELGWRDLDGDGPADPIDQNTGMFMWISSVAAGDLIQIYTLGGGQFVNLISVSPDMLVGSSNNVIFWDGSMYNDLFASWGYYAVSKNGTDMGTFPLNFASGGQPPDVLNHIFQVDTLQYTTPNWGLYIRHTVYDSLGQVYSRPRFDVMTNNATTIKTNIYGYQDGIYTSKVFGWQPSGTLTNTSTLTFINYLCGDANNDGAFNLLDHTFVLNRIFRDGPPPPHPASADVNCDENSCNILDLTVLTNYFFRFGPPPVCCHTLP